MWLVAQDGIAICFRCRDDEILVEVNANCPEPLCLLARVYSQLGDEEKSRRAIEKFRELKAKAPATKKDSGNSSELRLSDVESSAAINQMELSW